MQRAQLLLLLTLLLAPKLTIVCKSFAAARDPSLHRQNLIRPEFSSKTIRPRSLLRHREMRIEEEDYYMVDPPPRPRTPVKSGPIKYVDPTLEKPRVPRRTRRNIPRHRSIPPPSPVCPSPPCRSWPSASSPP